MFLVVILNFLTLNPEIIIMLKMGMLFKDYKH